MNGTFFEEGHVTFSRRGIQLFQGGVCNFFEEGHATFLKRGK
jgi:hypothetical protein